MVFLIKDAKTGERRNEQSKQFLHNISNTERRHISWSHLHIESGAGLYASELAGQKPLEIFQSFEIWND